MDFTIRRAGIADLPGLVALEELFPSDRLGVREFRHLLTRAHAEVWVAVDGTTLLGNVVILYRRGTPRARIYSLVVAASARRRGIARALVRAAENAAAARALRRVQLEVRCDNTAAIGLYCKIGYQPIGRLPRFYDDGQDALRLERVLPLKGSPDAPLNLAA